MHGDADPSRPHLQRDVAGELMSLAWPIIGLNVLNVLALAVDTAMCGRLPNPEVALAGLGFATQVIFLLMVAMIGLTIGTVATVARAHGAGLHDRVLHVLAQSSQLTIVLSVIVAVVGNVMASPMLSLLGAEGEALDLALAYLRPLVTGVVFNYLAILYAAVLRGTGDSRTPFVVAGTANVLNVILNYGFILGNYGLPALGVGGAALGTLCSQAFNALTLLFLFRRGILPGCQLELRPQPVDRELASDLIRIGWPAAFDMVVLNAAFLSIVGMLGRIDEVTVAAHGLGLRIQALAFVPGMSISQATGVLVGQRLGRGDKEGAYAVVRAAMVLCVLIMSLLAATIIWQVEPILMLFGVQPGTELAMYGTWWIKLLGYGLPIAGLYISFTGMLQGAGDTRTSLRINLWVTLVAQIPLSYALGFPLGLGAWGVWAAFPLTFVLKAALGAVAWQSDSWAKVGEKV